MDVNSLLQVEMSKELIHPKDFSSDKKIEEIFSCVKANKLSAAVESGQAIGKIKCHGSLLITFLMSKLHLYAVNAKCVRARHGLVCIGVTMLFFISIDGIIPISNRNMVLESIANIFLFLNKDATKIRHATYELCEHVSRKTRVQIQ